jgi:hypothetical protein
MKAEAHAIPMRLIPKGSEVTGLSIGRNSTLNGFLTDSHRLNSPFIRFPSFF